MLSLQLFALGKLYIYKFNSNGQYSLESQLGRLLDSFVDHLTNSARIIITARGFLTLPHQ